MLLFSGAWETARAQTTRVDLSSSDPQAYDTADPAVYRLDFPKLPPTDPMSGLPFVEPFAMSILGDPQLLFESVNRTGLPTPPATPGDYNPEEIFLMGNIINESPFPATIEYPVAEPREIILLDYGHPVYYDMGKLSRTFMFEETPLSLALPEIPDLTVNFDWQRHHLRQAGPFRMALDLYQSIAANSNVFGTASDLKNDTFLTFNPRLYFEAGTRGNVSLSYSPSFVFYQKYRQMNASNENITFSIRYPFTKLKVGADISYQTQSGLFLSSSGVAEQRTFLPRLFATYAVGGKTDVTATYYSVVSETNPGGRTIDHNFTVAADHRLDDKITFGIYQERGYATDPLGHQLYQTLGMRVAWRPGYHFRISGKGGLHTRWLRPPAGSLGFIGTPVFDFTGSYHRTSNMALALRIYRLITTDTFNSVNLQLKNGVEGSFAVRFYSKTDLRLFAGVGHAEQWSSADPQKSDFTFFEGSVVISHRVSRNVEVALFDKMQKRLDSSFSENYTSNIIGLAINLQF